MTEQPSMKNIMAEKENSKLILRIVFWPTLWSSVAWICFAFINLCVFVFVFMSEAGCTVNVAGKPGHGWLETLRSVRDQQLSTKALQEMSLFNPFTLLPPKIWRLRGKRKSVQYLLGELAVHGWLQMDMFRSPFRKATLCPTRIDRHGWACPKVILCWWYTQMASDRHPSVPREVQLGVFWHISAKYVLKLAEQQSSYIRLMSSSENLDVAQRSYSMVTAREKVEKFGRLDCFWIVSPQSVHSAQGFMVWPTKRGGWEIYARKMAKKYCK